MDIIVGLSNKMVMVSAACSFTAGPKIVLSLVLVAIRVYEFTGMITIIVVRTRTGRQCVAQTNGIAATQVKIHLLCGIPWAQLLAVTTISLAEVGSQCVVRFLAKSRVFVKRVPNS